MRVRAPLGALVFAGLGGQIIRHPDSRISAVAVHAPDMYGLRNMHGHAVRNGVTALAPGRLGVNLCLALTQAQRLTLTILFLRRTRRLLHRRSAGTRLDHAVQRDYKRGCENSHQVTLASQSHSHLLAPSSELQTQRRVPWSYKCFAIQDRAPVTKRQRSAQYSQSVGADTLCPFRNRYLCRDGRAPEITGRRATVCDRTASNLRSRTREAWE